MFGGHFCQSDPAGAVRFGHVSVGERIADTGDPFADVGPQACPTAESLDVIETKWRFNVLHDLHDEVELRFNELKESTGASSRTLSQSLDALTEAGLVDKRMEEAAPVATFYSLTEKGEALGPVFDELDAWAREYVDPTDYTGE